MKQEPLDRAFEAAMAASKTRDRSSGRGPKLPPAYMGRATTDHWVSFDSRGRSTNYASGYLTVIDAAQAAMDYSRKKGVHQVAAYYRGFPSQLAAVYRKGKLYRDFSARG